MQLCTAPCPSCVLPALALSHTPLTARLAMAASASEVDAWFHTNYKAARAQFLAAAAAIPTARVISHRVGAREGLL